MRALLCPWLFAQGLIASPWLFAQGLIASILAIALSIGCSGSGTNKGGRDVTRLSSADPLGERPALASAKSYRAPTPEVFRTAQGTTVWLIEKRSLPMVSVALVLSRGSAEDPLGKAGMAHIAASMLDEGAGDRDAIAISSAIQDLGATLSIDAQKDGSRVGLTVLKKHLGKAFAIFADVVARPRFEPKEYERVSGLWLDQLRRRDDNPSAVAQVVSSAVLYGPDTAYGHPSAGLLDSASSMKLDDVKGFYQRLWRPDEALMVVAGDIDKGELESLVTAHLADWKAPASAPSARTDPSKPLSARPRLVLVDRPGAPQAVISVVGPGISSSDPEAPLLDLINTALGGSFTSRLNQNLREDRGWTYGASSSFVEARGVGAFVARSAVFANVTAQAIGETKKEIDRMAGAGLTEDELKKVRARDLTDLIETHETLDALVGRLSVLAMLGLGYDFDGKASAARQAAPKDRLAALAKKHLDFGSASVVVVGPKDQLLPQLRTLDLGEPQMWMPDGRPLP